ncbi:MAG: U32 family peptidase [Sedimentisphaerales bacterium]|nr:U32 family peptidase [Sedimentisphaerales bacterium]
MELLAPAGTLEKLKWAVRYGADAVYFGTEFGSLRSFAGNFSIDDAKAGLDFLHKHNKKGYITLNIYPYSDEFEKLIETAKTLDEMGADAFIVSDLGVLEQLKQLDLKAVMHISTQANTTNYQSVLAYKNLGAKRVNLARELSLEKIKDIQQNVKGRIETEVFIHGAVCFSYSGRCAISDYLSGYKANRGECKHPCRWKYALVEETRPNEYMPVFEDDRGLYLFNSKELALFEFVPELKAAGITSIKIEGRMKSIHYIASVVSFYRQILDGKQFTKEKALELLGRVSNRGYSQGFMKGSITPDDYSLDESLSTSDTVFVANVTEEKIKGKSVLEIRNKIHAGDTLEALSPDGCIGTATMPDPLELTNGQAVDFANNSQFVLLDTPLEPYTILRRTA